MPNRCRPLLGDDKANPSLRNRDAACHRTIPITNEQPDIAARLAYSGAGRVIPVQNLAITQLRALVSEMLSNCSYKENAQRLQAAFNTAGGVAAAADLIEAMEQQ